MKATLEFDLPDEHCEYQQAAHAGDLAAAVSATCERLRAVIARDDMPDELRTQLNGLLEYITPVMPIVFGGHLT